MAQYIKSEFKTELALSILNEVQYQRYNYYTFLGKCDPWGATDAPVTLGQTNSVVDYKKIRNNIVYLKKIISNDISMVLRRINWTSDTPRIYDYWDDTLDMSDKDFYCVTDEWNVYKCLNNNNSLSTVKPTGTLTIPDKFSDGYVWKYMYTIPTFKRTKFATANYIPVQTSLSDSFYNKGSVENVVITDPGSGYISTPEVTLSVSAPEVGGTYAILVPSISKEDLYDAEGINIIRPAGSIVNVSIVDAGTEYLTPPTITINDVSGLGSGLYGNTTAVLIAVVHLGKVVNVLIEDPGQDYPAEITSTISVAGDGTGASFTPVISGGKLIDVITENIGTGYNYMVLSLSSATGSGAKMQPVIGVSDYESNQALVEQTALNNSGLVISSGPDNSGSIYQVVVEDGGSNYVDITTVTAIGDGVDFAATAVIGIDTSVVPVRKFVQKLNITNYGRGYTYINITVTDNNTGSNNAVIRAILPPTTGHGKDAISELCSTTVVINSYIQKDVLLNKFNQDYRQIGILKNPLNIISNTTFRNVTANMCFEVVLDDSDGLLTELISGDPEDILELDSSRFRVISSDGNRVTLLQIDNKYIQPLGSMRCIRTDKIHRSLQIISAPVVNKNSGKLLYVSEEAPFSFSDNQGLNVKTFLKF